MRKKLLFISLIVVCMVALCVVVLDVTIIRTNSAVMKDKPLEHPVVEPFPKGGNAIAVINGIDYPYDETYLFLMDPEKYLYEYYTAEELSEDAVKQLVLRELYALEADLLGLDEMAAENPDYEMEQGIRASHNGRFQWVLNADPALDPSASDITENQRKQALRYFELQEQICAEQNISAEELWIWADPYVRKDLKIQAYEKFVSERFNEEYSDGDMFQNWNRFSQYCEAVDRALMKKYDAELIYEK